MSIDTTAEFISQPEVMSVVAPRAPISSDGGGQMELDDESTRNNPGVGFTP